MSSFVTRFAPSPTGDLHLGHAYSALTAFRAAEATGGRFLLRIEDIDATRCKPAFISAILEDLHWLGLVWEEPVRRQSDHFGDYAAVLQRLVARGVVYRCFRTRKEVIDEIARAPHLAPEGPEGPAFVSAPPSDAEEQALLATGAPFAWRLSMAAARAALGAAFDTLAFIEQEIAGGGERRIRATPEIFGDAIIARKDAGTSYHLASVFDDALQGVSHVIRGQDLRAAAHLHRLLQELLELPAPVYRHHRLITDADGKRLAKRDRAATLRALRERGVSAAAVRAQLGFNE